MGRKTSTIFKLLIGAIGIALGSACTAGKAGTAPSIPPQPPTIYVLVWHDEFDGAIGGLPDPAKWDYNLGSGGWGNNELETYTKDTANAHVVADSNATDGKALAITALHPNNGSYTSARLVTAGRFTVQYGRIEIRAKLPGGEGLWPAFWLLGSDLNQVGWPTAGEIDVMESVSREPSINHGSIHGPGYSGEQDRTAAYTLPNGQQFKDAYHTFAIDWAPNVIKWYVDDQLYETRTPADVNGHDWMFDHPFFLLLNLAVGGTLPGNPSSAATFPQSLLVDYVRVYRPFTSF